ncbi:MAG: epoxyqueuosine reductase QueH [Clostridia bacterium]
MKKLLLHTCCAPCFTVASLRVKKEYLTTSFFYNPNINTSEEFYKRYNELAGFCNLIKFKLIKMEYNPKTFLDCISGHELDEEGGQRCELCIGHRLEQTAKYAKENGFDCFSTTLTTSPHKNSALIFSLGKLYEKKYDIEFLILDFKKNNGYTKSVEMCKEYKIYRQNYCGCTFSKR